MSMKSTEARIRDLIVDMTGCNPKSLIRETRLEDTGMDSMDVADLIMELEDEFDIEISDDDSKRWMTVGDVIKCIDNLLIL